MNRIYLTVIFSVCFLAIIGINQNAFAGPPPDSDNDGLPDILEVFGSNPTDPNDPDSDGDGLLDGEEDANANGMVDPGETDPNDPDSDGDGLLDGEEILAGTDPLNEDTDSDTLTDGDEINTHGTDPLLSDTDGDGLTDDVEIDNNSDPLDPCDPDDTVLACIQSGGQVIGGILIPIESTSLLLAGTYLTVTWLIPIIVSAAGIGLLFLRTKILN